jgi:hypothetical protein
MRRISSLIQLAIGFTAIAYVLHRSFAAINWSSTPTVNDTALDMMWAQRIAEAPATFVGFWSANLNDFHPGPMPMLVTYAIGVKLATVFEVSAFAMATALSFMFNLSIALLGILMARKAYGPTTAWLLASAAVLSLSQTRISGLPYISPWGPTPTAYMGFALAGALAATICRVRYSSVILALISGLMVQHYTGTWLLSVPSLVYACVQAYRSTRSEKLLCTFAVALTSAHLVARMFSDGLWFLYDIGATERRITVIEQYASLLPRFSGQGNGKLVDGTWISSLTVVNVMLLVGLQAIIGIVIIRKFSLRSTMTGWWLLWVVSCVVASSVAREVHMSNWLTMFNLGVIVIFLVEVHKFVSNMFINKLVAWKSAQNALRVTPVVIFGLVFMLQVVVQPTWWTENKTRLPVVEQVELNIPATALAKLRQNPVVVLDRRSGRSIGGREVFQVTYWLQSEGVDACLEHIKNDDHYTEAAFPCRADHPVGKMDYTKVTEATKSVTVLELVNTGQSYKGFWILDLPAVFNSYSEATSLYKMISS